MKSRDTSRLFEITKHAPTELSEAAVLDFIKVIPSLPPPSSNWFQNFNLNSIIMTTTLITLVTSAVIYFASLPDKQEQAITPGTIEVSPRTIVLDSADDKAWITPSTSQEADNIKDSGKSITSPNASFSSKPTSLQLTTKSSAQANESDTGIKFSLKGTHMNAGAATVFKSSAVTKKISLTGAQLRSLKTRLIKYVKEDELNRNRGDLITLEFNQENPMINHKKLDETLYSRYAELLAKYDITAGPDRRIVIDKKYIMVGDFTDEGFIGSALGRAMEINFREYAKEGLLWPKSTLNGDTLYATKIIDFSPLKAPKRTGGLFFQPSEKLASNLPTENGSYSVQFSQSKKSATGKGAGDNDNTNKLSRRRLKSLKRELYTTLLKAKVIDTKQEDVRLILSQNDLVINEVSLSGNTAKKLDKILTKHNVTLGEHMKLLMNKDFIMVGEFLDKQFNGSITGSLDSEKMTDGIFKPDFDKISLFKPSNLMGNKKR